MSSYINNSHFGIWYSGITLSGKNGSDLDPNRDFPRGLNGNRRDREQPDFLLMTL
jgi:hypothetical protein